MMIRCGRQWQWYVVVAVVGPIRKGGRGGGRCQGYVMVAEEQVDVVDMVQVGSSNKLCWRWSVS